MEKFKISEGNGYHKPFIQKTYKYRLRLSKDQEEMLIRWINTSRAVYNLALELRIYLYRARKVSIHKFDIMKQLKDPRAEFDWIEEVPSGTLQDVIERLDKAYQSFFKGAGFPKFAKRGRYNSITFKSIEQVNDYVFKLPKIGTVSIYKDRLIEGELRRATVVCKNGKFYISILTRQEQVHKSVSHESQVGIDVGLIRFATLSDGTYISNPRHIHKYERKLRIESRSLSRKKSRSNNWYKQKLVVSKLHDKVYNVRMDFLHKQSRKIVDKFGLIAVEDLKIKNMVQFGHLGKWISDVSWGEFLQQLEYKSDWVGDKFIRVNPKYTSQKCSHCGAIDSKSRISQSKYVCTSCGVKMNADENAAKNILRVGAQLLSANVSQ